MSAARLVFLLTLATLIGCDDPSPTGIPSEETMLVSPNPLEIQVGETAALRVEGLALDQAPVWTSNNPTIATVTAGGFVRGLINGTTTVTASVGSRTAVAIVMVGGRPPVIF